jgi:glucose-6-phosphate isomerase
MDGYSLEQAQSDLVAKGASAADAKKLAPHKVHPGNRPSNTIVFVRLSPESLGNLIALYEHKVFVEGVILGFNSFDQWGVVLGKRLATKLSGPVSDGNTGDFSNRSTEGLLAHIKGVGR